VNLNYLDPATVDIADYEADPDTFVEPHAGEVLYRLRPGAKGVPAGEPDGRLPSAEGLKDERASCSKEEDRSRSDGCRRER
jgi:lactate racemase